MFPYEVNCEDIAVTMRTMLSLNPNNSFFFCHQNGSNMDIGYDYEKCIGLTVKPRQGDGLLFYSLFVNGTIDPVNY